MEGKHLQYYLEVSDYLDCTLLRNWFLLSLCNERIATKVSILQSFYTNNIVAYVFIIIDL